ncbi:LysR family transcriptional regulator [Orrella sp. JC864]|uniref:LysR family transcriptional regulator n=1 Tax=Orrella sp. JC864 TaxID=3120298 RepID=UPI0012BCA2FA
MTPEQLITFACVAETCNISHAAERLHLSQPAVSGQLRLLQASFGEPLYRRSGRGIALTPTGQALAQSARHMHQGYQQALALRDARRGMQTGLLRLGASTTPASYLLPALVAAFRRRHPGVEVRISDGNTRDIVELLPELDMAFIEGAVPAGLPAGLAIHDWREDEVVAVVGADHPLAGRGAASLRELARYEFVMREPGSGVRHLVEQACARAQVSPRVSVYLAGVEGIKQAVRAGLGIGFVSALSMRHEDGMLRALRVAPRPLTRMLSILLPHADLPSRVAADFLQSALAARQEPPA